MNVEPIAGSYNASVYKQTKYQDVNGTDVCMQVLYYDNTVLNLNARTSTLENRGGLGTRPDNTGFVTSNWLCMLL